MNWLKTEKYFFLFFSTSHGYEYYIVSQVSYRKVVFLSMTLSAATPNFKFHKNGEDSSLKTHV